jgi:hypothetical protein
VVLGVGIVGRRLGQEGDAVPVRLFAREPDGKLALANDPGSEEPWTLEEAADLDGDGTLELLVRELGIAGGAEVIHRRQAGRYRRTSGSVAAILDCYC